MNDEIESNFSQTKIEYTKLLIDLVLNNYYDFFSELYNNSKPNLYDKNTIIHSFRTKLENIPNWNQDIVLKESNLILEKINCDYFSDIITAVYLSHTKILTTINKNIKDKKINLIIPKTENFIHKTFINIAREFWKNPLIFDNTSYDNVKSIENLISESIEYTIRGSLPIKDILKSQLSTKIEEHLPLDTKIEEHLPLDTKIEETSPIETKNIDDYYYNKEFKDNEYLNMKKKVMDELLYNKYNYVKSITDEPSEENIIKNTKNIIINDTMFEEQYDNPDIFNSNGSNSNTLDNNLSNIVNDDIDNSIHKVGNVEPFINKVENVEPFINKVENVEPFINKVENVEPFIHKVENVEPFIHKVENVEPFIHKVENDGKLGELPSSEVISFEKKNEDDTNTLDDFYNDLNFLTGQKEVTEKKPDAYTLFDN